MLSLDQLRQRALNFYTIAEAALQKKEASAEAWRAAKRTMDVDQPLPKSAGPLLGHLDWDDDYLDSITDRISRSFDLLDGNDVITTVGEPPYPEALAVTDDPPPFLFLRGRLDLLGMPGLAVVGTRNPSPDGLRRARKLGHLLAKEGIVVISGLAKGIDQAAHRGALETGGDTVAVLGTPLNRVYPAEHRTLQRLIGEAGLLVSQFSPSAPVQPYNFPVRNATMSGLAMGTIVVEASETSGALVQARKCLQQGRKLFIPQSAIDNLNIQWPKTYRDRGAVVFSEIEQVLAHVRELMARHRHLWTAQQSAYSPCSLRPTRSKP